jgi:hypothetical protein
MIGVNMQRGKYGHRRSTSRGNSEKMQVEDPGLVPQGKNHQRLPVNIHKLEQLGQLLSPQKEATLPAPGVHLPLSRALRQVPVGDALLMRSYMNRVGAPFS